jgi:low affinity Fe/Cu permease
MTTANPLSDGEGGGDRASSEAAASEMNKMTRALNRIACFANCHPRMVLALALASIVAVVGLGIFGAVSLVTQPVLSKFLLFAVITLTAFVVIQRNFTRDDS